MNIREFSQDLQKLYDDMGSTFSSFQKDSGLHCLPGCGKCCKNPEVEASVFEMIPLALRMLDENRVEEWLERLETTNQGHCLMYEAHNADGSQGKCTVYKERPSLCRMFGVSGYFNKHHEITLSVCKLIKTEYPELLKVNEAQDHSQTPMLTTWSYRMAELDARLIQDKLPINQAFAQALEKVALYAQYHQPS